ncbi:hypothetical protein [Bacillus sp. EB600]|uniref:hypothetical protein n=1 Tax=Bacillus sp. EB600 TaxID=2806345 RepID=UPI00210E9AC6|nr:hypothetical protein [Bacillus sp. EB600]MCQ6277716.1 hypothetical protein [Bacillus sp. EB600]
MSKLTYENRFTTRYLLDSHEPIYFCCKRGFLDPHTLRYRMFGAVWKLMDGKRYILGYWFADQQNEIKVSVEKAGWRTYIKEDDEISEIYKCIRTAQENENWKNRSKLPFISIFNKPLKGLERGMVCIKINQPFPMHTFMYTKKVYSIWIERIHVCETENDLKNFLNLINVEHNINLKLGEIQEKI